jgi:hypothetical protein
MEVRKSENIIDTITRTIDYLKKDIQHIIDKKKITTDVNAKKDLEEEKKGKMRALKEHTEKLKALHKGEREKRQRENELKRAERAFDSIEFGAARKKKDGEAMTRAKKAKEIREKAKNKFNEYIEYQKKYKEVDPKEYLGILFLHERVLEKYGMCPYIKIEMSDNEIWGAQDKLKEQLREQIRQKRLQWLNDQEDQGELYYKLYNQYIERDEIKKLTTNMIDVEEKIKDIIQDTLTKEQLDVYRDCVSAMNTYTTTLGKTKKIKEKYKELIHNLSTLHAETTLNIHEYISIKYKHNVEVNNVTSKKDIVNNIFEREKLDDYIKEYCELCKLIEEKEKYTLNIVRNLENDLYLYLTDQKSYGAIVIPKQVQQDGKYFKRWGVLSEEERNERFASYAEYHVTKFMMKEKVHGNATKQSLTEDLSQKLIEYYKEKKMTYRDLKWNMTKGYIEIIKVIKYEEEKSCFNVINKTGKAIKSNNVDGKKYAPKSVLTASTEKVIHEEILYYIVKKGDGLVEDDKKACVEKIKTKLSLRKLGKQDKKKIEDKYDEILQVVQNNKSD